jgi:hypothetical protein
MVSFRNASDVKNIGGAQFLHAAGELLNGETT